MKNIVINVKKDLLKKYSEEDYNEALSKMAAKQRLTNRIINISYMIRLDIFYNIYIRILG